MAGPARTPCRLFVYLAQDAPLAVVLRRGPSAWARLSVWNTATDEIEHGQWLRARVYERRCDLSADGAWFIAFVRRSSGRLVSGRDTWIALSQPPRFTAQALWFIGGTYCAGGCFPDGRALWLGFDPSPPDIGELPTSLRMTTDPPARVDRTNDWTERTVWLSRLVRDGWRPIAGAKRETWRRTRRGGDLALLMTWPTADSRTEIEYAVVNDANGEMIPLGVATWADWDQSDALVLARNGRLHRWDPRDGVREIADFNQQAPS